MNLPGREAGAQDQPDASEAPGAPSFEAPGETDFAEGRILVKSEEGGPADRLEEVNRANNARVEERLPETGVKVVDLPRDLPVQAAVNRYENAPGIEYAEPDFLLYPGATKPDDPEFGELYALDNTAQTGGAQDADIDVPEAWDITTGKQGTVVAVIDTGTNIGHPDLSGNVWVNRGETPNNGKDDDNNGYVDDVNGWDFYNDDKSVYDSGDGDEHGTHVAGTVAAEGDNGRGVTGVNWQADIMVLKFLGPNGGYTSDAVEALNYAVDNSAPISNNSWGGGGKSQALQEAIANADNEGHLFVAAAGNAGKNIDEQASYPASYDNSNIISVAATDHSDDLAGFSNYGAKSVDLGAPGVKILSTVPGGYSRYNGTSMAAPHVAGVAALLKSDNPGLGDAELKSRILESTDGVASLSNKTVTGARLNAATTFESETASSTDLTLDAGRSQLIFGQETALSGRLTDGAGAAVANEEVVLKRREVGATAFQAFSKATIASDGSYRLAGVKPGKHTDYRARFAGDDNQSFAASSSASKRVSVRVRVTNNTPQKNLKLGNRRTIYGAVFPSHAGSVVKITIKRNGEVINRRTVALNQYSRYRTAIKPGRPGNYAVFAIFPKDSDHLGNRSSVRSFKVVR